MVSLMCTDFCIQHIHTASMYCSRNFADITLHKVCMLKLQCIPAVAAEEHAPSVMLRQAMWVPTKEDEQAVSTASTRTISATDVAKSDLLFAATEGSSFMQASKWM